ncbi:NlpC/P60 domain-containing protein [uncultured Gammaproteobacteria bacterium]
MLSAPSLVLEGRLEGRALVPAAFSPAWLGLVEHGRPLDRRRLPWRPDLAADWLAGMVESSRYVVGEPQRVRIGWTDVRDDPELTAPRISQVLFGERFTVYDRRDHWAWGQADSDGYAGWVEAAALGLEPGAHPPSHRVAVRLTHLYPQPDLKTGPVAVLPLSAAVTVIGDSNGFAELACGGWVFARHLVAIGQPESDFVSVAGGLLGTPYLWGGRTAEGIDCSGLVQLALAMTGRAAPRDSDMQRRELGRAVDCGAELVLRRGDLVFFPGHVGLMADGVHLLHATAAVMAVTVEPLAQVMERVARTGGGLLAVRRCT